MNQQGCTARGDEIRRQIAEGKLEANQPVTAQLLAHLMDVAEGNEHGIGTIAERAKAGCQESRARLEQLAPAVLTAIDDDDPKVKRIRELEAQLAQAKANPPVVDPKDAKIAELEAQVAAAAASQSTSSSASSSSSAS